MISDDIFFMRYAFRAAMTAKYLGEIPVGAVITDGKNIIASGYNSRETFRDPLGHAEINAIKAASVLTNGKFLRGMAIYVTLEPCPMCAGAILEAGLSRIVFGAYDKKAGACGSLMNIADYPGACKRAEVLGGVMEAECSFLLQNFFYNLRKKRRDG